MLVKSTPGVDNFLGPKAVKKILGRTFEKPRTENDFLHETSLDYLKKSPLRAKLCPPLMNYVILKNQLYQSKYCWLTENG